MTSIEEVKERLKDVCNRLGGTYREEKYGNSIDIGTCSVKIGNEEIKIDAGLYAQKSYLLFQKKRVGDSDVTEVKFLNWKKLNIGTIFDDVFIKGEYEKTEKPLEFSIEYKPGYQKVDVREQFIVFRPLELKKFHIERKPVEITTAKLD